MKIHIDGILVWKCPVCDSKNSVIFEKNRVLEITDFLKENLACDYCKTEYKNGEG